MKAVFSVSLYGLNNPDRYAQCNEILAVATAPPQLWSLGGAGPRIDAERPLWPPKA